MAFGAILAGSLAGWIVALALLIEGSRGIGSAALGGVAVGMAVTVALILRGLACSALRKRKAAQELTGHARGG